MANNLSAQKWFPIGAKWHYDYGELSYLQNAEWEGYFTYEVEKDTIIEGLLSQKLRAEYFPNETDIVLWEPQYVRYDSVGDKVFHYWNDTFHLLYDFSLNVSDTFTTVVYSYPY